MSNELVSIIIPAYNHERYIEQTLDTIINQTYKDIELIILNDGSTDNTHGKIKGMEKRLNERFVRFVYINKGHEGICKSLNRGLDIAKGKYIIPFPSDDVMLPQRVKKQVEYLQCHKYYGFVYTDGYLVRTEGKIDLYGQYPDSDRFSSYMIFTEGYVLNFMLLNVFLMPTPAICVTRACYDMVGRYDERLLCEDPDMFLRMAAMSQMGYIKEILTLHRLHGTNSGRRGDIIAPSIRIMKEKYRNSPYLTAQQKQILFDTFYRWTGI